MGMKRETRGVLYLIPTTIGRGDAADVTDRVRDIVRTLDGVLVESRTSTLGFLRSIGHTRPMDEIHVRLLNEHTREAEFADLIEPMARGETWGLFSDAGSPAVADPGAPLVRLAHERGVRVVPLVGPSSILLALMASGLNGQSFIFHGYLPRESAQRKKKMREMETDSQKTGRTQIWMETPYRNPAVIDDAIGSLKDGTLFCIAADLTQETEFIRTMTVRQWREGDRPALKDRPAIFLIGHDRVSAS